ncbi:thiamine pyrophosphate-dependent enzyme [Paraburkholderia pallida]|uniref:Thiamine pyrophosphate-binding protein n=1 Tax=Paraburkholderia pallida TaxID=2547399 RepID=A0A4P7DAR4_9BURK|nr:thiamine pyrophosphate-dependent enzyme [Paraburkholderia pallida]QBR04235.1 thiamine pyrophosphate-binding protein [Paraburkholderia pallida]
MKLGQACAAIAAARNQHAPQSPLVTTMSAQFAFDLIGETARRIDSVPLMGGAAGLGLGIALAKPALPVIVVDGDASLLMELGGLVTVAHNKPRHFVHIVVHNGAQFNGLVNLPTAGTEPTCDFAGMARAAGYDRALRIDSLPALAEALPQWLAEAGTTFVELVVEADPRRVGNEAPQPLLPDRQFMRMRLALRQLRAALNDEPAHE